MGSSPLSVFVSSKMEELAPERLAIKDALEELEINGWVFERDAGARAQSIQQTFLEEVKNSDLYIGLFWRGYGDYTIEEFEHARGLNKDCLLYEKRTDIDGHRDERLQKWLAELDNVENGLTRKWFNTPQELKEFVKQDVARWQAQIVRSYKVSGAPQVYQPPQPVPDMTRKDLLSLLNNVERSWIKGVLEQSIHHQFEIELGKEKMGDAVPNPWDSVLEVPNQPQGSTPAPGNISAWFAEVDRHLLILGQPGSGKTITLLQLARDLIARARKDASEPIPTIFNLSSWSNKEESIIDWMVRELTEKYQVPKKIGRVWLDQRLLLPLLDGLDEVRSSLQDDCVRAINKYLQEYRSGLVVCSRLQEYMGLPERLNLNGAVCLQPLSLRQVEEFVDRVGPSLAALKHALTGESSLRELIQTPLMLSIISLAYENAPLHSLEAKSNDSVEGLRADVYDTYIERMITRKGKAGRLVAKEKLNRWLGWLARQMKSHSQSIFLVEQLQADWLGTRRQRILYVLISRLLAGLFLGSVWGISAGLFIYGDSDSVKKGLLTWLAMSGAGLVLGMISVLITCVKEWLNVKVGFVRTLAGWRRSVKDLVIYALIWIPVSAIATIPLFINEDIEAVIEVAPIAVVFAPVIGLGHWFVFEARSDRHRTAADITTVETLKWSWKAAFKSALKGALIVCILLSPIALYMGSSSWSLSDPLGPGLLFAAVIVGFFFLAYGFWGAVIGFVFGGFKEGIVEKKTKPNQGIRLTIRNAIVAAAIIGLLSGTIVTLFSLSFDYFAKTRPSVSDNAIIFAEVALFIGLPVAFRTGIYDAIKHYALRAVLVSGKFIPRHYIKILNYAVGLILLQKVGGGYIFIHRTLLEHYAATHGIDKASAQG